MSVQEIPLQPQPQSFSITLGTKEYRLSFTFIDTEEGGWLMSITDAASEVLLISCIPLVTGEDLLAQFRYFVFGGEMVVATDADPDAVPTFDNLGLTSHLYFASAA